MHYYQFNIADYRKDTSHLSRLEHSIYRDLIDWYYLDEEPIPTKTQMVMRRLRLVTDEEENALISVLTDFFVMSEAGWRHKRIDMEINDYYYKCQKNKENGKKGGRPKLTPEPEKTQSVILGNPNEIELNPNHKPLTINHKPLTINHKPINKEINKEILFEGVSEQVIKDFTLHRKNKKAAITKTAINGIKREATKAGISLETALIECCLRGWVGFKAEWYYQTLTPNSRASPNDKDEFNRRQTEIAKQRLFGINPKTEKDITNESETL